jgi:hypothetical protein
MNNPEELARRMLELTDQQDWAGREALLSPDCEILTPMGRMRGRAASTAYSRPLVSAFSDARHQIDFIARADDVVVVEGSWLGTHTGVLETPDGGIPATGKSISLPFLATVRTSDGFVTALHVYFDQVAFMAQLGLLPQARAA